MNFLYKEKARKFTFLLTFSLIFCTVILQAQARFQLVEDVRVGAQGSEPVDFLLQGNKILFEGRVNDTIDALYASDGNSPAVELLRYAPAFSLHGLGVSFYKAQDAFINGKVLFDLQFEPANDLYVTYATDGTLAGTQRLYNMPRTPNLTNFYKLGNYLYFMVANGFDLELWRTDATDAGTTRIKYFCNLNTSNNFCSVLNSFKAFKASETQFMFFVQDNVNGTEPWISDGTAAGTFVINVAPGRTDANTQGQAESVYLNGKFYFPSDTGTSGQELIASDATQAGTTLLKNINTTVGTNYHNVDARPNEFYLFGSKFLFKADDGIKGDEIWVSDGTTLGTKMLIETQPGITSRGDIAHFYTFNGKCLFQASIDNNVQKYKLYSTDGTPAGTQVLSTALFDYDHFLPKVEYNGNLYFMAKSYAGGTELWRTDGTAAGTLKVKTICALSPNSVFVTSYDAPFVVANGLFYFLANDTDDTDFGRLWQSDGTSIGTKKVVTTGTTSGTMCNITSLIALNGALYLSGNFNGLGYELWKYAPLVATESAPENGIIAAPNPTTGSIHLQNISDLAQYSLSIFDIMGRNVTDFTTNTNEILLPNALENGIYFLQMIDKNTLQKQRVKVLLLR